MKLDTQLPRILVAYCGKYSVEIGPPESMRALANLLSGSYHVEKTSNLTRPEMTGVEIKEGVGSGGSSLRFFKKRLSNFVFLKEVYILINIIVYNTAVYLFSRRSNSKNIAIISQPFLLPIVCKRLHKLIFVRRANRDITEILGDGKVKRWFERRFLSSVRFELIYLVDNQSSVPYRVIPNHFETEKFILCYPEPKSLCDFHWVGTWDIRKGADRLIYMFENFGGSCPAIMVYGGLGTSSEVNVWIRTSPHVRYKGVVSRPYQYFHVGDVFISLSYLEGFQRAMLEAMLQGCLVIAVERPDTVIFAESKGFFLIDWDDDEPYLSAELLAVKILSLSAMEASIRIKLGLENRILAEKTVSAKEVLKLWKNCLDDAL